MKKIIISIVAIFTISCSTDKRSASLVLDSLQCLMCSVNVDGAAAAVLVSEKKAKELGMQRAVRIKASVMTSDPYQERDLVMPDVNSCTRKAAAEAYEMAGLDSSDVDLVELHDCFATAEMLH